MSRPSNVRVGIVLPHSCYGEAEWQNAERAIAYADEAAAQGAQLVLYPEGYPGPMTGPLDNPKFPFDYRTQMSAGAIAAGPERMEGKRSEPGVLITDLDMERLRYLRTRNFDEENLSVPDDPNWRPIGCRPGQIYERDPALYRELAEPSPYSLNYRYWEEGSLDGWQREYDRIYEGDYQRILKKYGGPFRFKER